MTKSWHTHRNIEVRYCTCAAMTGTDKTSPIPTKELFVDGGYMTLGINRLSESLLACARSH